MENDKEIQINQSDKSEVCDDIEILNDPNQYLQEKVKFLTNQNLILKSQLSEKEATQNQNEIDLETLRSKLKEYENVDNKHQFTTTTSIISSKIVELSKKLREKNAEIEALKTKCSRLEKNLVELQESQLKKDIEFNHLVNQEPNVTATMEEEEKQKALHNKLNSACLKIREIQNSNIQLKNDLKLAQKYLQQETGESFDNINNCSPSGWRGRAQIICDLQQKNQDLREKLKATQGKTIVEQIPKKVDNSKSDMLIKENDELKNSLNEQQKKFDILKARCKVLESEQAMYRSRMTSLNSQIERDQNLICTLTEQINNQQNIWNGTIKQKDKCIKTLQQDNEALKIDLAKHAVTIENMTKQLGQKTEENRILSNNKTVPTNSRICEPSVTSKSFLDDRLVNRLEVERSRLLELTESQATRIANERDAHARTQKRLCLERQKVTKLESKLEKFELERNSATPGGSYCNLFTARSTGVKNVEIDNLKDELEIAKETIKALKTRLEIEQHERKIDLKEFSKILELSANPNVS